jgi:hypothetical protein
MNLHEAAEIVRDGGTKYYLGDAKCLLVETMLSELDPTPITEEWLDENGIRIKENEWFLQGIFVWWDRERDNLNGFSVDLWGEDITTLGELRTVLRLCGQSSPEKENDA